MEWAFDDFYSSTLIDDFDHDRNHQFEGKEIKELETNAFQKTKEQHYFTFVEVEGKPLALPEPTNFDATIYKDKVLYQFIFELPKPIDPRRSALTVTYYEDSHYIDVTPYKVLKEGDSSLSCKGNISENPNVSIYYGAVHPIMITIRRC